MIFFLACTDAAVDDTATTELQTTGAADHRVDLDSLPEGEIVFTGPEVVIEPGSDQTWCLFGTYDGDDVGMHEIHTYQGAYGHHFQLMGTTTPEIDVPDGTVVECADENDSFNMADLEPIGIANLATVGGETITVQMPLLDGMAVELEGGQRYVMQSHYVNTGSEPILVRDATVVQTVSESEVETWAAPVVFNNSNFEIPAGEAMTESFDCSTGLDEDVYLLYQLGHMHEWGTSFSVDRIDVDGLTNLYSIPEWDPVYRDAAPTSYYPDQSVVLEAGASYRTTCNWYNDTDASLVFPHEMCVTVNIVYPLQATVVCDAE